MLTVENCTCVTSKLCHPEDTVNAGQGLLDLRNICRPGLVCCLRQPDINIEIQTKPARQAWRWGAGAGSARGDEPHNSATTGHTWFWPT